MKVDEGRLNHSIESKPASAAISKIQRPVPDEIQDSVDDLEIIWNKVQLVAEGTPFTRSLVEPLKLSTYSDGRAVLTMNDRSRFKFAQQRSEDLGALFKQAIGRVVKVSLKLDADAPMVDMQSLVENDRKAMDHPLVTQVKDLFGAQIHAVERVEESSKEPK